MHPLYDFQTSFCNTCILWTIWPSTFEETWTYNYNCTCTYQYFHLLYHNPSIQQLGGNWIIIYHGDNTDHLSRSCTLKNKSELDYWYIKTEKCEFTAVYTMPVVKIMLLVYTAGNLKQVMCSKLIDNCRPSKKACILNMSYLVYWDYFDLLPWRL